MKTNTFLAAKLLIFVFPILLRLASPQLIPTEARVLFRAQKQLQYPQALHGWSRWTNFCYLPPSSSLSIVCNSDNRITDLTIVGNRTTSLSPSFSIDSFFTVLTKLSSLKSLSLVNLGLWGPLPAKINRFRALESLNLSSNLIHGPVPDSITSFNLLKSLVLKNNLFNGSLPGLNRTLVEVNLRSNRFTGPIPSSVFDLPHLEYLDLADNNLTGSVPGNVCGGNNVSYIDISSNRLVGKLPRCLGSRNRTVVSSWNCLSSASGSMKNQHSSSYCHTVALAVKPPVKKSGSRIKLGLVLGVIGGTIAITVALGLLIVFLIRRSSDDDDDDDEEKIAAPSFADGLSFRGSPKSSIDSRRRVPQTMRLPSLGLTPYHVYTLEEIDNATNNFDPCNLVADASQDQIYKAWLRDGSLVLVKCLKVKQRNPPQNMNQQMEMLSKLRNRHLVSILGHCIVTYQDHPNMSSTVFVVLEHVSNGSLKDHLTDWKKKEMLKWPQRMAIAIGITRGVQFLHSGVAPGVYGNDLKIENVQLDDSLTAKVGNYKLPLPFKTDPEGSPNRHAPETPSSAKQAEKEDVYQLGTILLQIIVGRPVKSTVELNDLKQELETSLTEHPTELRSAIDPSIRGTYAFQSLKTTVEVTVNCLATDPRKRPSIEDVLWNLQYSIQVQEGWTSSENLSTKM